MSTAEIPAHSHGVNDPGHAHSAPGGRIVIGDASILNQSWYSYADGGNIAPGTSANGSNDFDPRTPGRLAARYNNTQPTVVLNHIIST